MSIIKLKKGKSAIVTGGIGLFGVSALARMLPRAKIYYGVRSKDQLCFTKIFKMNICSDDGSTGPKKFVTELFHDDVDKYDYVYTCGPELMMKELAKVCKSHSVQLQASTERIMKCGIGFCASCVCDDKLVCK